jgi:hypothetical protein
VLLFQFAVDNTEKQLDRRYEGIMSRFAQLGLATKRIEDQDRAMALFIKEQTKIEQDARRQLKLQASTADSKILYNLVGAIGAAIDQLARTDSYGPKPKTFYKPTQKALNLFANGEIVISIGPSKEDRKGL